MQAASYLFNLDFTKEDIAKLSAKSERFIGVESGGMDQAISMMAEEGFAKLVHFNPIRTESIEIPPGYSFVVANSLVTSNKKETSETNYNLRVIECRLASAILGKELNINGWEKPKIMKTLQEESGKSIKEMIECCKKYLLKDFYTIPDICQVLSLSQDDLFQNYFQSSTGGLIKVKVDKFKLFQRSFHVFSEAQRVLDFVDASKNKKPKEMGELMNQSHFSLRDYFEASCDELEILTNICRNQNGCLGSRLTGAGWV